MAKKNIRTKKNGTGRGADAERRRELLRQVGSAARRAVVGLARTLWAWSWCFALLAGIVVAASLGTYDHNDPAFFASTAQAVTNTCGLWGAWLADLMFGTFGLSAWWFVPGFLMIAIFAMRTFLRRQRGESDPERLNPPHVSAGVGFVSLLIGSTSLEALRIRRFEVPLPAEPGGILGNALAFAVEHYIGTALATVLFFTMVAVGVSLLFDFSWVDVSEKIGDLIDRHLFSRFGAKKEETEEVSEPDPVPVPIVEERVRPLQIIKPAEPEVEEPAASAPEPVATGGTIPPAPKPARPAPAQKRGPVALPSLGLLEDPPSNQRGTDEEAIGMTSRLIVSKLKSYNIEAAVMGAQPGPVITQYWLEPGPGVKGSQIENARDDLRRALGVQAVRVVLSIPGTSYIGLEVPNPVRQMVRLKEILNDEAYTASKSMLTLALGKDIAGRPFTMNLAKAPHLLVAGTTGSGKSVGINAMILSLLYRTDPSQLRLVLIDPKMLEFSLYNGIPHLLCPVVTDMNKAASALKWLTREMDERYAVMSRVGVRHFTSYNEKVQEAIDRGQPIRDPMAAPEDPNAGTLEPWPYIVCVVDELADLMLTNRKEVEGEITRLTQKARAAGIHLILATQRPSVDVVTSLIKANVPTRISFQVASAIDSRVILGEAGAEQLLGNGDMLLHRPGDQGATRIQGCFVADGEVQRVVDELKKMGSPNYVDAVTEEASDDDGGDGMGEAGGRRSGESDPLYDKAVEVVLTEKRASISYVQRCLGVGYNRAANLLEAMEEAGIVSKPNGMGKRQILVPTRD